MILVIGDIKGGVGKTTLAVNIAISRSLNGKDVLLVDGDEQNTAITFTDLRAEKIGTPGYTSVSLHGNAIRTQIRQLATKYDDIIIDVGGRDTGSLRASLTIADTFLIPVQPRSFDIWAVDQVAELIKEAKEINNFNAMVILNAADAQGKDNEEAREALLEIPYINVMNLTIGRRKSFPNAASGGLSILEYKPKDVKAIDELNILTSTLYNIKTISE